MADGAQVYYCPTCDIERELLMCLCGPEGSDAPIQVKDAVRDKHGG